MTITEIELVNFKSYGPAPVKILIDPVTALVGENNSGKSNALLALDIFRNYRKGRIQKKDFHASDTTKEITIKVTFGNLDQAERRLFRRHLSPDSTFTVIQTIKASAAPPSEHQSDTQDEAETTDLDVEEEKLAFLTKSGIEWLDEPPTTKRDIEKLWKTEMKVGDLDFKAWSGLAQAPAKEVLAEKIEQFWDERWDAIPKQQEPSGSKPLGWPNRFMSHLPLVIFVPAAKKVTEEAKQGKTKASPFAAMLQWFVGSIQAELRKTTQDKLQQLHTEVMAALPKEVDAETNQEVTRLELINRELTRHLPQDFQSSLAVTFKMPEAQDTLFGEAVLNADDGILTEITDKGHGMQRAAMLAIIRAYLALRPRLEGVSGPKRHIVFAIEEPEIYLHPTVKRSTYSLFRELANAGDQVIYTTHDGYLVDVEHFQEIRVFRRPRGSGTPLSRVDCVREAELLHIWHTLTGLTHVTLESIRQRLANLYNPYRNEGFLSKAVLLCEGETEKAALPIYFDALDYNLDRHGVSIIDAGSVDLLDYFFILFTEFGIPVFILWDGDKPSAVDITVLKGDARTDAEGKSRRNKNLAGLCGLPLPARGDGAFFWDSDQINERCAVFATRYEHTALNVLPGSEVVRGEATRLFGSDSKPLTARYYANTAISRGKSEGDPGKYVPSLVAQMVGKLKTLIAAEKMSVKLAAVTINAP